MEKELVKEVENVTLEANDNQLPKMTPEQIEFVRLSLRKNFNEKYSQWAEIAEEPADDEFIKETIKDFEEAVNYMKTKTYVIATAEGEANIRSAELLKHWNTHANFWDHAKWRGVTTFDRVIDEYIKVLTENPEKDFVVDYSTLMFLYASMKDPAGIGLESALRMAEYENYNLETCEANKEDFPVTYSGILEKVFQHVAEITAYDKKIGILKLRMDYAQGSAKMILKIDSLEEFIQFSNAWTTGNLGGDDSNKQE